MPNKYDVLLSLKHSPIYNYIIPGVTSWLIGEPSKKGLVRLFECSRNHQETVVPHNHKFDFQCLVLGGRVQHRVFEEYAVTGDDRDFYHICKLGGVLGEYQIEPVRTGYFGYIDSVYKEGDWYYLDSQEFHSITFSKNTKVLFFEGPNISENSCILQPHVDGIVPTFQVRPWMFRRPGDYQE